jgi:hypothetical protein
VFAHGHGLPSQASVVLLWKTMRVTGRQHSGLPESLARWRAPRAMHDPGKIIADQAAVLALGGDCLADIAVGSPELPLNDGWIRAQHQRVHTERAI